MAGTSTRKGCRYTFCSIFRIVLSVVNTVVEGIFCAVFCFLCWEGIAVRVCHCNGNSKRIKIVHFLAGLVHHLLGNINTALQGVGCGKAVGKI